MISDVCKRKRRALSPRRPRTNTMQVKKEVRQIAREMLRASFTDGQLDRGRVASVVDSILAKTPRNYLNILEEIETKIAGLKTSTTKSNIGTVREAGDGVARIEGLSDVMLNEMIEFPGGVFGLALNLEETEVGAILLGDATKISEGDEAKTTGRLLSVPVGKGLLGRVVNTLGEPLDGKGEVKSETFYPLEKNAPGVIKRRSVIQPVQT